MLIPIIYPISSSNQNINDLIISLKKLKLNKISVFQYRRKHLDKLQVKEELELIREICKQENINYILNSSHKLDLHKECFGLHLTSKDLYKFKKRPLGKEKILGASCHNKEDMIKAESLGVDYIFLSPVKKTSSHIHLKSLGWLKFQKFTKETNLPVLALGGLEKKDLKLALKNGAYGVAGISKFW